MKATLNLDGTWSFEDVTITELRELMGGVANGKVKAESTAAIREPKKRGRPPAVTEIADLNETQAQTWQWLIAHDTPEGLTAAEYAKDTGIKTMAADNRIRKLVELGLAYQIARKPNQRGYRYRAGGQK